MRRRGEERGGGGRGASRPHGREGARGCAGRGWGGTVGVSARPRGAAGPPVGSSGRGGGVAALRSVVQSVRRLDAERKFNEKDNKKIPQVLERAPRRAG